MNNSSPPVGTFRHYYHGRSATAGVGHNSLEVPPPDMWVPDVSYPNFFVTQRSYKAFLKRVRGKHGLGLGLMLVLE